MSSFDPKSYAEGWRRRNREEAERIRRSIGKARREAEELADRMRSQCAVERVILFGSLARKEGPLRENFDIDLAIIGGSWECARDVADESEFSVDLLEYERAPGHIRRRIDTSGEVLE